MPYSAMPDLAKSSASGPANTAVRLDGAAPITEQFRVPGVDCRRCVRAVQLELGRLEGVQQVDVHPDRSVVIVTSWTRLDPMAVAAAVDDAGYQVVP